MARFQRSENNRNLIYGTYIGDGDSKAYSSVKNSMPYGPLVYINKEECRAPDYGRLLKITKVCFVSQISSHTPAFLIFQIN